MKNRKLHWIFSNLNHIVSIGTDPGGTLTQQDMREWTIAALAKAKTGDPAALTELIRGLSTYAYRIARFEQKMSQFRDRDRSLADEAASYALCTLWGKLHSITASESSGLSAWLHTVTRNYFVDLGRLKKNKVEVTTDETWTLEKEPYFDDYPSELEETTPDDPALDEVLSMLEPQELDLITMRYLNKLTTAEIARILATTEGAVKQRVRRVVKKLRLLLLDMDYNAEA